MEFESHQTRVACGDVPMYAHMVEALPVPAVAESDLCDMSGGRSMNGSHGHGFHPRTLCQICGRYGHLAQRCFYHFNRDYKGPNAPTMAQFSSAHDGQGQHNGDFSGRSAAFGGSGFGYYLPQARVNPFAYTYPNEAGHGVGLASGPHMLYGPYDKPHIGRDMRRALGRDLGRDLGQHCVGPSVVVHRPSDAGQCLRLNGLSGQNSGQANLSPNFGLNSLGPNANYVDLEGSMQNNVFKVS
ncbi:hypothetical protein PVK06_025404 [Gossypium arboreum]|uniref:CCHC-type domain-containing protein n=1 Tax=Gossypium arboreum TaxID=29729 RepID=A0ABR0PGD1_GOSAR|nr:hypothetical protein PVK06_025404 [Gossypium arboreum]